MATGDKADIVARLKALLPNGWFGDDTPVLDIVLSGIAAPLAAIYSATVYAKNQTRIATATDGFLDLISFDYLGLSLPRKSGESDASFLSRIKAHLFLEKGTRAGMIKVLQLLTGRKPKIFEPSQVQDAGGYNTNSWGYGVAGGYGSLLLPYQAFIIAYRPSNSGIPFVAGYGNPEGAFNTASQTKYATLSEIIGAVTDADIFDAINQTMPVGTTAWVQLSS